VRDRLEGEVGMIARILTTLIIFGLAVNAFWSNAFGEGHLFNPFGILFLFLAAIVWFAWDTITEAFKSVTGESYIPILRMGAKIISGMTGPTRKRHHSDEPT
jgi:RsiW-degrading membrane proteinase PrsW (M82 family)